LALSDSGHWSAFEVVLTTRRAALPLVRWVLDS
jgi:hypothetical protein